MPKLASFRVKLVNFLSEKARFSFLLRSLHFGSNRLTEYELTEYELTEYELTEYVLSEYELTEYDSIHFDRLGKII